MAITETIAVVSDDSVAELQLLAEQAAGGIRDLDEARLAAKDVDAIREANRRFGEEAIGVSIIREFRGSLPE